MAGIYGWFAFPQSNMDTAALYEWKVEQEETFDPFTGPAWDALDEDEQEDFEMAYWAAGCCFYKPTEWNGLEYQTP